MTKAQEARARYEAMHGVSKMSKAELFEERAKKLGERFGLDIKPNEWQAAVPDDTVLRMDKPIRMRVRRTCHRCNATFSSAKECPSCQHVRCTKCARYPPKRTEAEIIASREKRAALIKANKENAPIIPDWDLDRKEPILKRPSKTGGQDLVYKKPRQRVRRTCHECQTMFMTGTKTCGNCGHIRCTDCPRDPYVDTRAISTDYRITDPIATGRRRTNTRLGTLATNLVLTVYLAMSVRSVTRSSQQKQRTEPTARSVATRNPMLLLVPSQGRWSQNQTRRS